MNFSPTIVVTTILHNILYFFPRNKKIWVFIGWHRTLEGEVFTDNTKYLFIHVSTNESDVEAVWLAKSEKVAKELRAAGFRAYYEFSILGIWYALRAGATIIDAYLQYWNYAFLGKSNLIQILHGKGMKAKGYSLPSIRNHDLVCYPSKEIVSFISEDFVRGAKKVVTGYGRSDVIMGKELPGTLVHVSQQRLEELKEFKSKGVKTLWYVPTFRRNQTEFNIRNVLDLPNLEKVLEAENLHLFISLHPKYHDHQNTIASDRVTFLGTQDFFPLYQYIDLMITDYSSTFTDYLLLDRPVIFYPYDLSEYLENEGILIDYEKEAPGPKAYTPEELNSTIVQTISDDTYQEARAKARARYHDFIDDKNCERTTGAIKEIL